jgi:hypothetical protein
MGSALKRQRARGWKKRRALANWRNGWRSARAPSEPGTVQGMIILAGALAGGMWGGLHARKRGGVGFDIAQYAAVWGIIGAIIGMFATVAIERML